MEPDLLVVNRYEYEQVRPYDGLVALTMGAEGAVLLRRWARGGARNAAGGACGRRDGCRRRVLAALVVGLLEGRERAEALTRACAAGAIAASRAGAQPSLPTAAEVDEILAGTT